MVLQGACNIYGIRLKYFCSFQTHCILFVFSALMLSVRCYCGHTSSRNSVPAVPKDSLGESFRTWLNTW